MADITLDEYKNLSEDELEDTLRAEKSKMLNPNHVEKDLKKILNSLNTDLITQS